VDDLRRRFGEIGSPQGSDVQRTLKAAKMREQIQDGIDAIDATPDYCWLKSTALDTVMSFVERDKT
jgi:deoxyribose-phosphate aldolase